VDAAHRPPRDQLAAVLLQQTFQEGHSQGFLGVDLLPLAGSKRDFERWLSLRAARAIFRITGNPNPAVEIASRLLDDGAWWLVIHAADLLSEVGSDGG
jgi:hypothetical protein